MKKERKTRRRKEANEGDNYDGGRDKRFRKPKEKVVTRRREERRRIRKKEGRRSW